MGRLSAEAGGNTSHNTNFGAFELINSSSMALAELLLRTSRGRFAVWKIFYMVHVLC